MLFVFLLYSFRTRVLFCIARSVVFVIPRLLLYFVLDSCTKFIYQIVIYRQWAGSIRLKRLLLSVHVFTSKYEIL